MDQTCLSVTLRGASRLALCLALAAPALAFGGAVHAASAQDQPVVLAPATEDLDVADEDAEVSGNIIVTGSRVVSNGFASPTPVMVIDSTKLQVDAPTTIGEVLVRLPGFRDYNSPEQRGRFAGGAQFSIDLRGLGGERTLLLLDGRRLNTGNTNLIPMSMIDRVDVVTGGASSAYGSDAVAGVVNLVTRDRYDGMRVGAQYGITEEGDGEERAFSVLGGASFADDRIHLIAGGDYADSNPVDSIYSRDWAADNQFNVSFGPDRAAGTPAQGFLSDLTYGSQAPGSLIISGPLADTAFDANGQPYAFEPGTRYGNLMQGGANPTINPGSSQYIVQPVERYAMLGRLTFDLTDDTSLFVEAGYGRQDTYSYTAHYQTGSFRVNIDNPYIPDPIRTQMQQLGLTSIALGRVHTDVGDPRGRVNTGTYDSSRFVFGGRGTLAESVDWDFYLQHGESDTLFEMPVDVSPPNLLAALYAIPGPDGEPICGPVETNPNLTAAQRAAVQPGCVPFNPFGVNQRSQAALDYVTHYAFSGTHDKQDVGALNLRFEPFSTWAGPIAMASGVEIRKEKVATRTNPLALVSGNSLFNPTPYEGERTVKEAYLEALIPLAQDTSWADDLNINVAGRITDYSTSGTVKTWKIGFSYATPFGLLARATRSRDIAAPSLANLFAPGSLGSVLNGGVNPFNGQTGRVSALSGGNADLEPEVADTWTAGLVYQPEWLPGFGLSVDYYDIEIANVIATPSASDVLNRCAAGVQAYCDLIVTDESPFGIAYLRLTPSNLAERKATGMDFELSYRQPADGLFAGLGGDLSFRALASYVQHLRIIDAGGPVERAGSGIAGLPNWTVNVDTGYTGDRFSTNLNFRWFSTLKYDTTLVGPEDEGYDPAAGNSITSNRFPSRLYVNLSATLTLLEQASGKLELFGNINNLLDTNPPEYALPAFFQGGNPYSIKGRFYRIGARYEF